MTEERATRRHTSILSADVVDHSCLLKANEVTAAQRLSSLHRKVIEPLIARSYGRIIHRADDSLLVQFDSVVDAVTCAVEWQDRVTRREVEQEQNRRIRFRIGIHRGDLVGEREDVQGDAVDIARRLMPLAPPDGLCISEEVWRGVRGCIDLLWTEMGPQRLKNASEPINTYCVIRSAVAPRSRNVFDNPDRSSRPLVIERNAPVKDALLLLALGLGVPGIILFGLTSVEGEFEKWFLIIVGIFTATAGVWGMLSGPTVVRIGNSTVRLVRQRFWWSDPRTREWPLSEFKCIRVDYSSQVHEDGTTSYTYSVKLVHQGGRQIDLSPEMIMDESSASTLASDASRALDLPVEWAKKEFTQSSEGYELRPPHRRN